MRKSHVFTRTCILVLLCAGFVCLGCTTIVPVSATIGDSVYLRLQANKREAVAIHVVSHIRDGEVAVMNERSTKRTGKIRVNQGTALRFMLSDYMTIRFPNISQNANAHIRIILKDFSVRDWDTTPTSVKAIGFAVNVLRVMRDKDTIDLVDEARMVSVRLTGTMEYTAPDGTTTTRPLVVTTEGAYADSFASGTSVATLSRVINDANNRLLMQLNIYFDELKI